MPHTLLVADDSAPMRREIELALAGEDIEVLTAGDGRQAIEIVQAVRPDLVLAEVSLPGLDGFAIAAFIKSDPRLAAIPVLLLHSAREPIDAARAADSGCDGALAKPFDPRTLIHAVTERLSGGAAGAADPGGSAAAEQTANGEGPGEAAARTTLAGSGVDALEAYFERLGTAFEELDARPGRRCDGASTGAAHASSEASAHSPAGSDPTHGERGVSPESGRVLPVPVGDVLATLFKPEANRGVKPFDPPPVPAPIGALSEDVIDEIARRVLRRLNDDTMRALIVETAERVVREEIARIKAACAGTPTGSGE